MSKKGNLIQFVLSLGILVVIGLLSSFAFTKFDLTEEKRHTLTSSTVEMLENLDDQVFVKCYLHGEFPAKFKRLEQAIKEKLDEFVDCSNGKVSYTFIDPYENTDAKTQNEIEVALYEQGLEFTRLSYDENGTKNFTNIWPAAIVTYQNKDYPVQLFNSTNPDPSDEMVNGSINNIEYELGSKLRYLVEDDRPRIAILEGHGELGELEMLDFTYALQEQYFVERVEINGVVHALSDKLEEMKFRSNKFELLIVAKPDSAFANRDKVVIDQFIMNGGKVLWMIDPILTDLDSLRTKQQTFAVTNEMGLYDMLFDYGVRLNRNMVIDYQCTPIALDAGPRGNQRNYDLFNWYYAPVVLPPDSSHPITANLDPIALEFASSLEFVGENDSIQKTILLQSSPLSKELKAPVRVNSAIVNFGIDYFQHNPQPNQMMGALLEGSFESNFNYRLPDTLLRDPNFAFRAQSRPTKMIVIADGDIARSKIVDGPDGAIPVPLGFDKYAGRVIYDNKEFLLNCVNYLMDDDALISMRSRSIVLRKLNEQKCLEEKSKWQTTNMLAPLIIVGLFGFGQWWFRKRKFATKAVAS
jgi:gliding-associated putative ABC transporter substrate-binding component GldG